MHVPPNPLKGELLFAPPLGGWGDCGGRGLRLHHLLADILGLLLIGRGLGVEIVGEEDETQDDKEDNHLDGDNQPQGPSLCHGSEAVDIEVVDTLQPVVSPQFVFFTAHILIACGKLS